VGNFLRKELREVELLPDPKKVLSHGGEKKKRREVNPGGWGTRVVDR